MRTARRSQRAEDMGVDAVVNRCYLLVSQPERSLHGPARVLRSGDDAVHPPRDDLLHEERIEHDASHLHARRRRLAHLVHPVDRQWVMHVRHHRHAGRADHQRAVAQRLDIVDDVEFVDRLQLSEAHEGAPAERRHDGELAGAAARQLIEVQRMEEAHRSAAIEEDPPCLEQAVDAVRRHAINRDRRIRFGPRWADDQVDIVAKAGELAGDLRGVDALAAGVHVALVEEEEDLHRAM